MTKRQIVTYSDQYQKGLPFVYDKSCLVVCMHPPVNNRGTRFRGNEIGPQKFSLEPILFSSLIVLIALFFFTSGESSCA